jgi:hypothetical protein
MPAATNHALDLIDEEFPLALRPLVPPALKRAYSAADRVMETTPFLCTPSGRYQRGDLIMKAAEWEFRRLIDAGSLPFDPAWESYAAPTGKHLVMRTKRARITINQIATPAKKPRPAKFRDNYGVSNMEYLWPEWNDEARAADDLKHLVLLHGYQELVFAKVALPHPTKRKLIEGTDNLMGLVHEVPDEQTGPREEGPADSPDPEAIDNLLRIIRDDRE